MRAAIARFLLRIVRMLIKEIFLGCLDMILQQAASWLGVLEGQEGERGSAEGGEQGGGQAEALAEEGGVGEDGLLPLD